MELTRPNGGERNLGVCVRWWSAADPWTGSRLQRPHYRPKVQTCVPSPIHQRPLSHSLASFKTSKRPQTTVHTRDTTSYKRPHPTHLRHTHTNVSIPLTTIPHNTYKHPNPIQVTLHHTNLSPHHTPHISSPHKSFTYTTVFDTTKSPPHTTHQYLCNYQIPACYTTYKRQHIRCNLILTPLTNNLHTSVFHYIHNSLLHQTLVF